MDETEAEDNENPVYSDINWYEVYIKHGTVRGHSVIIKFCNGTSRSMNFNMLRNIEDAQLVQAGVRRVKNAGEVQTREGLPK